MGWEGRGKRQKGRDRGKQPLWRESSEAKLRWVVQKKKEKVKKKRKKNKNK